MTWLELEPARAPETPEELERMADWLRLAELLDRARAGADRRASASRSATRRVLEAFASSTPRDEPPLERELRIESLARLASLDEELSGQAWNESLALTFEDAAADPGRAAGVQRLPDRARPQRPLSAARRTLPELVLGRSAAKSTTRGYLYGAVWPLTWS